MVRVRFCLECLNFEDRSDIDGNAVCAKNHRPGTSCDDFKDRYGGFEGEGPRIRFCSECSNLEDRSDIEGVAICGKNHRPGSGCEDFKEKCCYHRSCSGCDDFIESMRNLGVPL